MKDMPDIPGYEWGPLQPTLRGYTLLTPPVYVSVSQTDPGGLVLAMWDLTRSHGRVILSASQARQLVAWMVELLDHQAAEQLGGSISAHEAGAEQTKGGEV
jgi:hypothetical protein